MRNSGGKLDILDPPGDFPRRVTRDLAVLAADGLGQLPLAIDQDLAESEQHVGSLAEGRDTPPLCRSRRDDDRGIDLLDRGKIDFGLLLAGGRIEDRATPTRAAGLVPPADKMGDDSHGHRLLATSGNGKAEPGLTYQVKRIRTFRF